MAQERQRTELSFTTEFEHANGVDICIAAASPQLVEQPFSQLLSRLSAKPKHLLINKVPLYDGPAFVTLQHLGPAVCPYHVFNKREFIDSITSLGYELVDSWPVAQLSCYIPFHPDKSVSSFSGLYFTLQPCVEVA